MTGGRPYSKAFCTKLSSACRTLSASTTSVAGTVLTIAQLLQKYYYTSNPGGPPCTAQPGLGNLTTGQAQAFPHLQALP